MKNKCKITKKDISKLAEASDFLNSFAEDTDEKRIAKSIDKIYKKLSKC